MYLMVRLAFGLLLTNTANKRFLFLLLQAVALCCTYSGSEIEAWFVGFYPPVGIANVYESSDPEETLMPNEQRETLQHSFSL